MIRVVIVDDEPKAISSLKILLGRYCPGVKIIANASNINEANEVIQSSHPDLVFLDINMPSGSGLDLMQQLNNKTMVVFVTAYEEYAIQAFRMSAFDYLLKPVDKDELISVVDRLSNKKVRNDERIKVDLLQQLIEHKENARKIAINTSESLHVVEMDEILYLSSNKNYTQFHLRDDILLATKPLGFFEELLTKHKFLRVHRSHVINLARTKEYRKKQMKVVLDDGSSIEVARNRREELVEKLLAI